MAKFTERFNFSIYTISLQVILITYFGSELETLRGGQPLEGSKVCYH